jgi:hypothetical protein
VKNRDKSWGKEVWTFKKYSEAVKRLTGRTPELPKFGLRNASTLFLLSRHDNIRPKS